MPSANELPRWYKALVASDSFHWDIYKRPVEPAYPCYAIQIDVYGIDHAGYCSGYSDDVDDYLDDKKENLGDSEEEEYQNKLQSTSYTAWLPLTDSDGKQWDFEINRFKDPTMRGCYSEDGSGYCHIDPVVVLRAAVKIDK
jgi:hypothetical protein